MTSNNYFVRYNWGKHAFVIDEETLQKFPKRHQEVLGRGNLLFAEKYESTFDIPVDEVWLRVEADLALEQIRKVGDEVLNRWIDTQRK